MSDSKRLVVPLLGYAVGVKLVDSQSRAAKVISKRSWSLIRPGSDGETLAFIDAGGNKLIVGLAWADGRVLARRTLPVGAWGDLWVE